jgi:hypothetical protein
MFQMPVDLLKLQAENSSQSQLRRSKSVPRRKFSVMCCMKAAVLQHGAIFFLWKRR